MAEKETKESTKFDKVLKAIIAVRKKCEGVSKTGYNKFHDYHYATEADISSHIGPLMDSAGLVVIPSVANEKDGFPQPFIDTAGVTQMVLKYTLAHESGQVWPEPIFVVAHGDDHNSKSGHGDKGAYKANTGGFKYFLLRLFMLETGDDGGSSAPAQTSSPPPQSRSAGQSGSSREINEAQARKLKAVSYTKAEQLDQTHYTDLHHLAASIRVAVKENLGISDGDPIVWDQMDPLISAMENCQQSPDGSIWCKGDEPKHEEEPPPPLPPSDPPF